MIVNLSSAYVAASRNLPRMSEIQRPRGVKRPPWYTPERARAFTARIAAGETLKSICAEPDMPGEPVIFKYLRRHDDFAQAYREARRTALRRADAERMARMQPPRPKDPRKPGRHTKCTPRIVDRICRRLEAGESLDDICKDADMPSRVSVHNWLRKDPALAQAYMIARQVQADRIFDEVREVARAATPATVAVARLTFDVLRWQAARLWPRRYGYYAAEDLDAAASEPQAPQPESEAHQVVIRQFGEVDGKFVEILTPQDAISYRDARQRALPAPEDDEEMWLAKGGDPNWRDNEAQKD